MTRLPSSCSKFIKLSDWSALSCCRNSRPLRDDFGDVCLVNRRHVARHQLHERTGLVDDIDRLIRQESIVDVPRGERHGGAQGVIRKDTP